MTSLHERSTGQSRMKLVGGAERRQFRRHDLEPQGISVDRVDPARRGRETLGQIVDLSASGVRIRTTSQLMPDHQVRVRLELPAYAGICPFVDTQAAQPKPKREWTGWLTVARVQPAEGNQFDVAGRLVDMEEMDRGMLSLYLSTQPLAA